MPRTGTRSRRSSPAWPPRCTPHGKTLSVAVFAKTADDRLRRGQPGPGLRRLGRAADQVRIMAYNYHWGGVPARAGGADRLGARGAALRQDPDSGQQDHPRDPALRIRLSGGRGSAVTWLRAFQLGTRYHARPSYDTAAQEPWFGYNRGRPPARRLVREPGQLAGEVRGGGPARGQAGSSCGCSVRGHQDLGRAARRAARAGPGTMIPWWGLAVGILGVNFLLWGVGEPVPAGRDHAPAGPSPQRPGRASCPQRPRPRFVPAAPRPRFVPVTPRPRPVPG